MNLRKSHVALAGAFLALASCSSDRRDVSRMAAPVPSPSSIRPFVAHQDARVRAPSFVWLAKEEGVRFETALQAATTTMEALRPTFALEEATLASIERVAIDDGGRGPIVARFRQRTQGIDVFRGGLAIAMTRTFDPVSASGFLAHSLAGAARPFVRTAREALEDAYAAMTGGALGFTGAGAVGDYEQFTAHGLAEPARVKKVLYPNAAGVVPAYYVEIQVARGPAFSFVVSAQDGEILFTNDLVRADAPFGYRVYADPVTKLPFDGPQGNGAAPHPTGKADGFRPTFGETRLVTLQNFPFSKNDPWLAADATTTSGNNVRAHADLAGPDGLTGDSFTPVSSPGLFDYAYQTAQSPGSTPANVAGAVTHLFYVTNFLHDWFYDAGYDESAGNHQTDNFGRGGLGRDALKAEAQDYGGRNNANATVPSDGAAPRLQMYVFSGPSFSELSVASPAPLAGVKRTAIAGFGIDAFDVTGTVLLASDDQGADSADACEPLTSSVAGSIVLVHRGVCPFVQKAQNVEAAGGIGCIVTNVASSAQPNEPPFMGGTSAAVGIPILSLALADGQALEAAIPAGATVRLRRELTTDLDGSLDTTIVAHEWGHVLSGRLVGDGNGLSTNQAGGLGEGWADFLGLLVMARADDLLTDTGAGWKGAYPNGAYATSGGGADFYYGIRRLPYSTDFTKNALTFKHIQNGTPLPANVPSSFGEDGSFNAQVHSTGEVWATMLWECYAALLRESRLTFGEAQDRMKRYLVTSLKLTPPDPTLLEARDALLAAAFAADEADFRVFLGAFGRRGAGVGAEGPPKDSSTNQGVKESYFVGNDVQLSAATLTDDVVSCDRDGTLDDGETGTLAVMVRNSGPGLLGELTARLSSTTPGISFPDGDVVKLAPLAPFKSTQVSVRVQLRNVAAVTPAAIDVAVSDPSFEEGRVQRLAVSTRLHADESAEASTVDHVDTKGTSWIVEGEDLSGATKKWTRVTSGLDGIWSVPNPFEIAEHRLRSPSFTIEGSTFELAFKHRWSFRSSTRRQADIDGGVVEVSVDTGRTWRDISDFGVVDYNTTLDSGGRGDNALKGRRAYGNKSAGYPGAWIDSRIKVALKAHPESVRVRFMIASGTGFSGAPGWEIDQVELSGISSQPFWSFVDHADACDENAPTASAGGPVTVRGKEPVTLVGSGTHPGELPLTFVWTQVAGPPVVLKADGSPRLDFEAPDTDVPVTLTFALRAHDGTLLSPASRVDVTVLETAPTRLQAGGGGCSTGKRTPLTGTTSPAAPVASALGLLAAALLVRRRTRRR